MATKAKLTLSDLKRRTGITDCQLDKEIDKEQCRRLASLFGSWKKYADTLGLRPGQINDVKYCFFEHGTEMAMNKALQFWLDYNPYQTYRDLIDIILELGEGHLAHEVITFIKEIKIPEDEEQEANKSVFSPIRMESGDISDKIDHFQKRFGKLITSTLSHLEETNKHLEEIKRSLLALPLAIRNEHEKLHLLQYSLVDKAESVRGVFAILTSYLSYLDYSLLEHIIKEFGSKSLKSEMNIYARDMTQFRMNTTISSIIPHLPGRRDHNKLKDFSELKEKINFDPDTMTLEDLNEHRKRLASEFLLSDFALLMTQLSEGSLEVEWLIPRAVVLFLKQFVKDKSVLAIEKLQISQLSIDEELLYPLLSSEELTAELPQQEAEKVSRKMLAKNEPWLVLPEDVSYPEQPKFTSTQNNAITTEGAFKGTPVAVKRLNLEISKPENEDAIRNEIHILSLIRHPNIAQFIAATHKPQIGHMIVTELLKTSLASTQRKRIEETHPILIDIALALIYLHTHKEPIIHRDVNPANIYLIPRLTDPPPGTWHSVFDDTWDETWMAKLTGFGLAIFAKDANTANLKVNTTEYTAPETPGQISTKADIYGFGNIMKFCPDNRFSSSDYGPSDASARYEHDTTWEDFLDSGQDITWDDISHYCTQTSPDRRPTMSQALEQLNKLEEL